MDFQKTPDLKYASQADSWTSRGVLALCYIISGFLSLNFLIDYYKTVPVQLGLQSPFSDILIWLLVGITPTVLVVVSFLLIMSALRRK